MPHALQRRAVVPVPIIASAPSVHVVMGADEVNMPKAIAEFGYYTERIENPDEIEAALKRALEANDKGLSSYLEFVCSQYPVYGGWAR